MTDKTFHILLLPGDGVGPEVLRESRAMLDAVGGPGGVRFEFSEAMIGGAAIDAHGVPIRNEDVETALQSDSVLLGAMKETAAAGFDLNTRGCRQWGEGMGVLRSYKRAGTLPHLVVMELGTDWTVSIRQIRAAMALLGPGRVLGLMPHPERHIDRTQHPRWTRGEGQQPGDGLARGCVDLRGPEPRIALPLEERLGASRVEVGERDPLEEPPALGHRGDRRADASRPHDCDPHPGSLTPLH